MNNQLKQWVNGNSVHDHINDTCCPDFSCCNKDVKTPKDIRERFSRAIKDKDEKTKHEMLGMFLGHAIGTLSEKKVYITGLETAKDEH